MNRISFVQEHQLPLGPGDIVFRQSLLRNGIAAVMLSVLALACLASPSLAP